MRGTLLESVLVDEMADTIYETGEFVDEFDEYGKNADMWSKTSPDGKGRHNRGGGSTESRRTAAGDDRLSDGLSGGDGPGYTDEGAGNKRGGKVKYFRKNVGEYNEGDNGAGATEGTAGRTVSYSRKKTVRYIPYSRIGSENIRHIRSELTRLYDGEDGVADGIAIENGETVYIVDSGRENGEIRFGVKSFFVIEDEKLRAEYLRRKNDDSISKGYISDGLSSRFGDRSNNNRLGNLEQVSGEELPADKRESQDIGGGISVDNENRRGRGTGGVSFSRKTPDRNAPEISLTQINRSRYKVFTKADAESIISSILHFRAKPAERVLTMSVRFSIIKKTNISAERSRIRISTMSWLWSGRFTPTRK